MKVPSRLAVGAEEHDEAGDEEGADEIEEEARVGFEAERARSSAEEGCSKTADIGDCLQDMHVSSGHTMSRMQDCKSRLATKRARSKRVTDPGVVLHAVVHNRADC